MGTPLTRDAIKAQILSSAVLPEQWRIELTNGTEIVFTIHTLQMQSRLASVLETYKGKPADDLGPDILLGAIRHSVLDDARRPYFESIGEVERWIESLPLVDQEEMARQALTVMERSGLRKPADAEGEDDPAEVGKESSTSTPT